MSIGKFGSNPSFETVDQQLGFQAALADNKITFAEAQRLKQTYGTKEAMIKALTNPDNPMVTDAASAQALADMVFKADKYTGKMRTAELEAIAIDFVDGVTKPDNSGIVDPWDDGQIDKSELTFRSDFREQAKVINDDRKGWYQAVVAEGYKQGPDGNLYLPVKAGDAFVQDLAKKHGLPADTFGSVKDLQDYAGVKDDGKLGTGTIEAFVYKGADVLESELQHGKDPAKRSDQDKLAVAVLVDIAIQRRGGGEAGKQKLMAEARAIVDKGGPSGKMEKLIVAAALELQPDQNARLDLLGLDEASLHQAIGSASPGDRPAVLKSIKTRTLTLLPLGQGAAVLDVINREEGLALRADTIQKAKKDPLGHDAYKVRGYESIGRLLTALTSQTEYKHVKGELKNQIVSELNEWKITNPYELGEKAAQQLQASGIRFDPDTQKWTSVPRP